MGYEFFYTLTTTSTLSQNEVGEMCAVCEELHLNVQNWVT